MLPGAVGQEQRSGCVIVEALVVVGEEERHRGHFSHRPGTRPAERYLGAFEEIRALQAHLARRAQGSGVAVIDNGNLDEALAQLIELVLDAVERAT